MKFAVIVFTLLTAFQAYANGDDQFLETISSVNIRELQKISNGAYCLSRSLPPTDAPVMNHLDAIEITFEDGVTTRAIPLGITETGCSKERPQQCFKMLTLIYPERVSGSEYRWTLTRRTIAYGEGQDKLRWKTADGRNYGIAGFRRISTEAFLESTGTTATCQIYAASKRSPEVQELFARIKPVDQPRQVTANSRINPLSIYQQGWSRLSLQPTSSSK